MNRFLIISNWKMQLSYRAAVAYLKTTIDELTGDQDLPDLIFCPSFDALHSAHSVIKNTPFQLGAQDCSAHANGSYTGQVQAQSLAEIGCTYSIIGHNELRKEGQTSELIALKMIQLSNHAIIPIVCVGETAEEKSQGNAEVALQKQLIPIIKSLKNNAMQTSLVVAYEPVWAIGSSITPTNEYIRNQLAFIKHLFTTALIAVPIQLVYGGSVDDITISSLLTIPELEGILLGKASLDSQKFKKIVRSCMSTVKN